jgi:hypothetical protein
MIRRVWIMNRYRIRIEYELRYTCVRPSELAGTPSVAFAISIVRRRNAVTRPLLYPWMQQFHGFVSLSAIVKFFRAENNVARPTASHIWSAVKGRSFPRKTVAQCPFRRYSIFDESAKMMDCILFTTSATPSATHCWICFYIHVE